MATRSPEPAAPGVGDAAPPFELPDQSGRTVRLADFRGRQHVILYFYPKDDTPGCTREACDLRDRHAALGRKDVAVLGVSADPVDSHARFAAKYDLPFPLLADEGAEVSKRYGVWKEKNLYGRRSHGIERTTFLIDREGVVRRVFPKVRVDGHARELEEAVAALDG
jgi:peroxiredoxin Q/BCP